MQIHQNGSKMSITVREENTYYQLEFNYNTPPSPIVIPAPTIFLDFKIHFNSHLLTVGDNEELVREIATSFWPFWDSCHYDTSINISEASEFTFTLVCKDSVFELNALPKIASIEINLSVLSIEEILLQDLMIAFDYLMTSWFLNEEHKHPAIFSPTGRQFIKLNLFWYKKMCFEVLGEHLTDPETVITKYIEVVGTNYTILPLMGNTDVAIDYPRSARGKNSVIKSYPLHLVKINTLESS